MKKKVFAGLLLSSALLLFSACSTNGKDQGTDDSAAGSSKEFNSVVQQEMPSADPSIATDTISFTALNNVYEGIYRLNAEDQPEPAGAAEKAEISEDGLTYRIKLKEDAKWSNGDPVVADDYVYGWQRTVDPKTKSEYAYLYEPVKNASPIINGEAKVEDLGIKAVNDHELEITLEKPVPYFDYLLAFPSFFPQNRAIGEKMGDKFATKSENSVYNGPFTLEEFDGPGTDTDWVYKKNEQYWDKDNVALDKVNVTVVKEPATSLNLFNDGQADDVVLSGELAQQNKDKPGYFPATEARTAYLEFNQREANSPYKNANLRKAFSYAIDREALVKQVLADGSAASTGLIPKDTAKNPETGKDFAEEAGDLVPYDKDKAKKHWEQAKKELGIDTLTVRLNSSDDDITKKVAQYIQNSLEQNLDGVKITPEPVPFSVRLDRESSGNFDVTLSGWGADYLDPSSFTDLFITGSPYNRGHWSNQTYDDFVKSSQTAHAANPKERWNDLMGAQNTLIEEMAVIPVYQKVEAHLINPKFKNIVHHAAGAGWDYKWTTVEE